MGTKLSGTEWQIAVIAAVFLLMPTSMFFAQGAFVSDTEYESFYNPETQEDFEPELKPYAKEYSDFMYASSDNEYRYYNGSSGSPGHHNIYTKNYTDNNYHEALLDFASDDDDKTFDHFISWNVGLNVTIDELIEEDMSSVEFSADFPRNGTVKMHAVYVAEDSDGEDYIHNLGNIKENVSGDSNMTSHSIDISYSKMLEADSEIESDWDQGFGIVVEQGSLIDDDEFSKDEAGSLQPGDSLQFNINLQTDYTASPIFTTNLFSALWGIFFIGAAIFSTPVVDLADIRRLW